MVSHGKFAELLDFEMYQIPLRITMHPAKPLIWWYKNRDSIDMEPSYQRRGRLWSASDKGYLIDSIINGFDVPKLYLADFQMGESSLNRKRLPYAIIDGKQRLEAVFDFFDGTLVLNADFKWRQDPSLELGGLSLRDLRLNYQAVADSFETETLDIMSVVTSNEKEINELFVRLNRSKPLTGAEIRNAMSGPVSEVIRSIGHHEFFSQNIRFSTKRAADYNAAAKLLLFEYEARPTSTKKKDLDYFVERNGIDHVKLELAARRTFDNLTIMQDIFLPYDELLSSAGILPVYYWLIRETPESLQRYVREFLVWFERKRKENRANQISGITEADQSMSRYDTFNRSTNDIGSHSGRFDILKSEFDHWYKSPTSGRLNRGTTNTPGLF